MGMNLKPEEQLSVAVADWCRIVAPWDKAAVPFRWMRIANERPGTPYHRAVQKRMGIVAGAPDFVFWGEGTAPFVPDTRMVFVELKAGKGRQTKAQLRFQERCGAPYYTARSLERVQDIVSEHFQAQPC